MYSEGIPRDGEELPPPVAIPTDFTVYMKSDSNIRDLNFQALSMKVDSGFVVFTLGDGKVKIINCDIVSLIDAKPGQ